MQSQNICSALHLLVLVSNLTVSSPGWVRRGGSGHKVLFCAKYLYFGVQAGQAILHRQSSKLNVYCQTEPSLGKIDRKISFFNLSGLGSEYLDGTFPAISSKIFPQKIFRVWLVVIYFNYRPLIVQIFRKLSLTSNIASSPSQPAS